MFDGEDKVDCSQWNKKKEKLDEQIAVGELRIRKTQNA